MKRFFIIAGAAVLCVAGVIFFYQRQARQPVTVSSISENVRRQMEKTNELTYPKRFNTQGDTERKKILKLFIEDKLIEDGGIRTNYLPNEQNQAQATGHEKLSESAGLYLLHLALSENQAAFDSFYKETKDMFYENNQFSYRVSESGERSPVNASLDDLRILRSLLSAQHAYNDTKYESEVKKISRSFIDQSTDQGLMVDFYDSKHKEKAQTISFFYLDYATLAKLYRLNDVSADVLQYQVNLAKKAKISSSFPLYQQKYNYESESYESGESINIIESLLTIRYLAEIGEADADSLRFVKDNVAKGTLFNSYTMEGDPVDTNQSAASYAIAAWIGYFTGDEDLYTRAIEVMDRFQVMDQSSPIYGGIGDAQTLQVYSFNNLTGLVAYDL